VTIDGEISPNKPPRTEVLAPILESGLPLFTNLQEGAGERYEVAFLYAHHGSSASFPWYRRGSPF
jgi:hypothetical protein